LKQVKVQRYSTIAQKINADFLCDEGYVIYKLLYTRISYKAFVPSENPLMEGREEQEAGTEIEHTLAEVKH
jgi:hypothetical protein